MAPENEAIATGAITRRVVSAADCDDFDMELFLMLKAKFVNFPSVLKSGLLAAFVAGVVSLAFLMPVTLQMRLPDTIAPLAWHFCPETGQMAPRYYRSRSSPSDPGDWVACLDARGERIEDFGRHQKVIFSIAGFWFCLLFPLLVLALRPLFMPTEYRLRRRAR